MKLPDNSIGITDLLTYRDCGRKFSYGIRRHTGPAQQSDQRTPESGSPQTAYGSAVHDVLRDVEEGYDESLAIGRAFSRWGALLEPSDTDRFVADLATYRARDFPNTRTVANEDEFRVPLLVHDGVPITFRGRVDRLYERVDQPGTFIHVDYKSSRGPRTNNEVQSDLQMWAYDWAIHEYWPEVTELRQFYDQLRYGQIAVVPKTDAQREQIRSWLVDMATAVLDDNDVQDDGLLDYRFNEWCPWCPILESCLVVNDLTDFALTRIAALAPAEKQGRKTVLNLDPTRAGEYVQRLARVKGARAVLKRFDESVGAMLKDMPDEGLREVGFEIRERGSTVFTAGAARQLHEQMGEEFYELVAITKAGLESHLRNDPEVLRWALELGDRVAGTSFAVPRQEDAA